MERDRLRYIPNEIKSIPENTKKLAKKGVLYVAEKSVYMTIPITAFLFYTGAISATIALLATGGDVVTSKWAGNERRKMS